MDGMHWSHAVGEIILLASFENWGNVEREGGLNWRIARHKRRLLDENPGK